ncbi:hypothetical protein [Sphingomonas sp. PAMC 26605]|uniref:hypothetical protein n=1 Tax=Sphingomonas sp. PAMC 26605 TaxID=1112214 RepID=UPI00049501FB|nr:hypothetical protein [Sphingomonas sp. PAMC 26605]
MVQIVLDWEAFKVWLSATTGLSHHDIHLIVGVLLTMAFTVVLRVPLWSWRPLSIVLALELVNETFDFARYSIGGYPWGPVPSLIDIALTIVPAGLIVSAARLGSRDRRRQRRSAEAGPR